MRKAAGHDGSFQKARAEAHGEQAELREVAVQAKGPLRWDGRCDFGAWQSCGQALGPSLLMGW